MAARKSSIATEKKMLYLNKPSLTNSILQIYASARNTSESAVAEQLIWEATLPKNPEGRFICENRLFAEQGSIGKAMEGCFQTSLAGVNRQAKYFNMYPLVVFAYENPLHSYIDPNEPRLHHFISQFESICSVMNNGWEGGMYGHFFKPSLRRKEMGKYCMELLEMLKHEPEAVSIASFFEIFFEYWDMLNDWTVTHRALADLMVLQKGWIDTPEERIKLASIISKVSEDWGTGKAKERTLAIKIKELQHDIIVKNIYTYEFYNEKIKFDMPSYWHALLHGPNMSIDSLCYQDIPNQKTSQQELYDDLALLKAKLEEGEKRIRKEIMGYNEPN